MPGQMTIFERGHEVNRASVRRQEVKARAADLREEERVKRVETRKKFRRGVAFWRAELDLFQAEHAAIYELFIEFHKANPSVMAFIVASAPTLMRKHDTYSVRDLLRYSSVNHDLNSSGSEFRMNNNFSRPYALLAMIKYPHLDGFFRTRS